MRPYNVEIFDRHINYKYSTLVDPENFQYSEDAMDPVKNTLYIPRDFVPSELDPDDENAPRGWYVRITNGEQEYQGIITTFEVQKERCVITYSQMITLLNLEMLVLTGSLALTTVEGYIADLITREFIDSDDDDQIIPGLTSVTTTSSTVGTFPYTSTDDDEVIIDFLDDIVYLAFELFAIVTKVTFDPQQKTVNITVGKNAEAMKVIEADLPNVFDQSFTIQKYSREINKIDVYDIDSSPAARYDFYLHNSGSWDSDATTDRILPVVNTVLQIKGYAIAKAIIDAQLAEELEYFESLNETKTDIPWANYTRYRAFADKICPPYCAEYPLTAPSVSGADVMSISSTYYETDWQDYEVYCSGAQWSLDHVEEIYKTMHGHCRLRARVTVRATASGAVVDDYFYYSKPFSNSMARTALASYKKTAAYEAEISAVYAQAIADAMTVKVGSTFAKNKYCNLIELSALSTDPMIEPLNMQMGRIVEIIHDGVIYNSVLSGREVASGVVKLIFGTIRLELTSYLKGRY